MNLGRYLESRANSTYCIVTGFGPGKRKCGNQKPENREPRTENEKRGAVLYSPFSVLRYPVSELVWLSFISLPIAAERFAAGRSAGCPPGGAADAGVQEADAAITQGHVHAAGVRRGGHAFVAGAGVAHERERLHDEVGVRAGQPNRAVPSPATGKHG